MKYLSSFIKKEEIKLNIKSIKLLVVLAVALGFGGGCSDNAQVINRHQYTTVSNKKYYSNNHRHREAPNKAKASSVLSNSVQNQLQIKHRLIKYNGAGAFVINNNHNTLTVSRAGAPYAVNQKDAQGRPHLGNALLTKAIRQYANRAYTNNGRTDFKPAGFKQQYLGGNWTRAYDRGHILAYSLVGHARHFDASESNSSNIATQTMWANEANQPTSTGQNYFETIVRKAVDRGAKVRYRVTDIYNHKSDLVPSGAHIEAKSDDGLSLNVFVPNVQPNMTINYQTGVVVPGVN